jgi:hypothetical protein
LRCLVYVAVQYNKERMGGDEARARDLSVSNVNPEALKPKA